MILLLYNLLNFKVFIQDSQDKNSTMEQVSIKQFTQPTQPFASFKGPPRTLQPMRQVPKVKRPVGRPRKRPCEEPETQVQPSEHSDTSQGSSESSKPSKKVRAAYTIAKKQQVVKNAKEHSIYQASKHFHLSPGTNRAMDEDRLFQREHCSVQSCWKW